MARSRDSTTAGKESWVLAAAACAVLGAFGTSALGQRPSYELTDLGTLGGDSIALAMNDQGMVVGRSEVAGRPFEWHAFVWAGDRITDLYTLGGTWSEARDVNNNGEIVGVSETRDGRRGFYARDGVMYDLTSMVQGPAPGGPFQPALEFLVEANAINDDGHIVGCGFVSGSDYPHGFLLMRLQYEQPLPVFTYEDLGELPGALGCVPTGINRSCEVVGVSGRQAFMWYQSGIDGMDELPAPFGSRANAVSSEGNVVGWTNELGMRHGCLWTGEGRYELGYLPNWVTEARDLNDHKQAVGTASYSWRFRRANTDSAMLWDGLRPFDLNGITEFPPATEQPGSFTWTRLTHATAIDEKGRIAGYGVGTDGSYRAFLLTLADQAPTALGLPCQGDFDGDGDIGVNEFLSVLGLWGSCVDCDEDINGDDLVGIYEFLFILGSWGPCP